MNKQKVVVLGASGSIGRSTAAELAALSGRFEVKALVGRSNLAELAAQAQTLHPEVVVTTDDARGAELRRLVPDQIAVRSGMNAVVELAAADDVDVVLCAISGIAGLEPALTALRCGKKLALASKEVLVMAGDLVMAEAARSRGMLVPVDSEHSGVFQCLAGRAKAEVAKMVLTASGGPFLHWSRERIAAATVADALKHPTWSMGGKITIDSASMMNKALELIEAHHLFGVPESQLGVLINPQSVVHALITLNDGSAIAQMSVPNMRLAIRYGLTYPERLPGGVPTLALDQVGRLEFFAPDNDRFPALELGRAALRAGGSLPAVLNGANDVAVARFRSGEITFSGIWKVVEQVMGEHTVLAAPSLDDLKAADDWARRRVGEIGEFNA